MRWRLNVWSKSIDRCLGYLLDKADQAPRIWWSRIIPRKTSGVWKMWTSVAHTLRNLGICWASLSLLIWHLLVIDSEVEWWRVRCVSSALSTSLASDYSRPPSTRGWIQRASGPTSKLSRTSFCATWPVGPVTARLKSEHHLPCRTCCWSCCPDIIAANWWFLLLASCHRL